MKTIRIACGQGFWGDWLEAPVRLIEGGPVDYLVLDYLAEVTMSIMQKQKSRNPKAGFATDFVALMDRILPQVLAKKRARHCQRRGRQPPSLCRSCADGRGQAWTGRPTADWHRRRRRHFGTPRRTHGGRSHL